MNLLPLVQRSHIRTTNEIAVSIHMTTYTCACTKYCGNKFYDTEAYKAKPKLVAIAVAVAVFATLAQDRVQLKHYQHTSYVSASCYKMHHVNAYFVVNNVMFNSIMCIPRTQVDLTQFTRPSLNFL